MVRRKLVRIASLATLLCGLSALAQAQLLPEAGADPHEGVASCATSVCHGKVSPDPDAQVWMNEYRVWLREDYHSRAYKTLRTAQSKTIARKLGLASAHTAKICLDCHADNIPVEARGRRFQISDGVGCEACHGGSGQWLESHAEETTSHEDNLAKGMYPTEQPLARARLCLSCHLGTKDKLATHRIMGAGHPRLAFELETFTVNQPAHYQVDADYAERKPAIASVNMWLSGLAMTSIKSLELLQEEWFTKETLVPELTFYQCHACHHPMDDLRWEAEGGKNALPPGSARLNDASLVVLAAVLEQTSPGQASALVQGNNALHQASLTSRAAVVKASKDLHAQLVPLAKSLSSATYSSSDMRSLRSGLLKQAVDGKFRHFTAAEQVFMAVDTLCLSLSEADKYSGQMDAWFKTMDAENTFVPAQYSAMAKKMLDAL